MAPRQTPWPAINSPNKIVSSFFHPPPITSPPSSLLPSPSILPSLTSMAATSMQLLLTTFSLTIPLLLLLLFAKTRGGRLSKKPHLPPGPPGWPVVGNLFQVAFSGKQYIHYIRDLIPSYGPIFTLRMGSRTLIFITSPELAHEAFIEKGHLFASRPAESAARNIFSCNKFTVNSAVYGPEWRSLRRNMVSGMLSSTRLREFHPARRAAMDRFIDHIRAEAESAGGAVRVLRNARFAVFCILISMCFGVELDEEATVRIDNLMKKVLITCNPKIEDFLPLLGLFSRRRRRAVEVRREQIDTIVPLIERRRDILRNPGNHPDAAPFSYLDSLLDLRIDGRDSSPTDAELVTLCSEFLNGGTDTTATAIEWGIAQLIDKPWIQSKLYEEITAAVGGGVRVVDETDTERMVYLQAFVKELLRKHPPAYFSLSHAAVQPGKLGSYDVPMDANLEIYLPAISEDPRLWREPGEFEPERFVTGGETADLTGVKEIKMIPFGAGRRVCPGLGMGKMHIMLMLARMVQAFEWRPHTDEPKIDFGSRLEFTVVMNRPLRAMVVPRKQ